MHPKNFPNSIDSAVRVTAGISSRSLGHTLIGVFAAVLLGFNGVFLVFGQAEPKIERERSTVIRSFDALWQVANREEFRDQTYRIDLEFTVLYYDSAWNLLWLENERGIGSFVPVGRYGLPISSGQRVRASGELIPSIGLDSNKLDFTILDENAFPESFDVTDRVLTAEQYNLRWVSVEGYVDRQNKPDASHLTLNLVLQNRTVEARVLLNAGAAIPNLEGKVAKVEGLFVVTLGDESVAPGLAIWSPDVSRVTEIKSSIAELFSSETVSIADLADIEPDAGVRIEGIVHSQDRGNLLTVRDNTGLLQLSSQQASRVKPGQIVEIVGYPEFDGFSWTLSNAVYRISQTLGRQNSGTDSITLLRLSEEVLRLDPQDAAQGIGAELSGVVTFVDPNKSYLYINDRSGGLLVKFVEPWSSIVPVGSKVSVEGVTVGGAFAPYVQATSMEVAGSVNLPVPSKVTLEQAMTGIEESRWIEMQGYFQDSRVKDGWVILNLVSSTGEFSVHIPVGKTSDLGINHGSILSVRGVCVAKSNSDQQLIGISLLAPSLEYVSIEKVAPKDRFESPITTIANLRRYRSTLVINHQVQVKGVVLYHNPGHDIFLSDGEEVLHVLSRSASPLLPGDEVDVVGYPGRSGSQVLLRDSVYRKTGFGKEPVPLPVSLSSPFDSKLHGHIVEVEGVVFDLTVTEEEVRMIIDSGTSKMGVTFKDPQKDIEELNWDVGARVRLSGIYVVNFDEYGGVEDVDILLRNSGDVIVLEKPTWWTARNALLAAAGAGGALILGLFWAVTLRLRVAKQTELIRLQVDQQSFLLAHNKRVLDGASDFIYSLDLEGRFTSFNPAGERMTGYSESEAKGMTIYNLLNQRDSRMVRMVLSRRRTEAESRNIVNELTRRDGQKIWVETSVRFIRNGDEISGIFSIMRDITARKLAEDELKKARDAAEATTKAKNSFFATMSHELRTPMNGVIGMTNVLLDTNLSQTQRDYACTVRDSAESLLVLLNDILDLSKAEAGKLSVEQQDFDLLDTLNRSTALLEASAGEKAIKFVTTISDDTPCALTGDAGRLRQVLLNLGGNAIKFTEKGKVEIGVSKLSETLESVLLRFEVTDTGIGISKDGLERMFSPFEQADGSHSRRFGGTGLGLAICKQIVELMGGEIGVESAPGEGSTFWFEISFAKIEGMDGASIHVDSSRELIESDSWSGKNYKILIAEDMPINQKVTRLQLKKLGFEADLAENGFEVLEAVKSKQYDIILMDCQMPKMDGFEATERLRQDAANTGLYIVALTANAMEGDRKRCLEAGMNDFVSKPTRPEALSAAFQRYSQLSV